MQLLNSPGRGVKPFSRSRDACTKSKNMIAGTDFNKWKYDTKLQNDGKWTTGWSRGDRASLGLTSLLASSTLGTMCGRQRPSISMTLASLSAIRHLEKTTGLSEAIAGGLLGMTDSARLCFGPCLKHFCFTHTFKRMIYEEEGKKPRTTWDSKQDEHFCRPENGFKTRGEQGADREAY